VQDKGGYWELDIPVRAESIERSHLRLWLVNEIEVLHTLKIPLQKGHVVQDTDLLSRSDRSAWNMYFVFLDRFKDGNSQNNRQVDDPEIHPSVNYYGGDIQGLIEVIKTGYFDSLSVNTLWLSPIIQNPEGAYGLWDQGGVRSTFSGYHGYWPISSSRIDDRMGTEEDLNALIELAHEKDMNILLDYVANHVHQEHPVMEQYPEWKTDLYLPDGTMNTQLWDEQRLTTWFDTFMPSLDFSQEAVVQAMSDSALYWVDKFDIDGFRHDATKHIPLEFWRTLTTKINQELKGNPERSFYQIGETYGSRPLIASYVRSGLLDAQFDFSLFDAAQASFGQNQSMRSLAEQLRESIRYYGLNNQMGVISGNHDKARFISLASGEVRWDEDAKLAAWTRDIPDPGQEGYARLQLMHTWIFTVPGIPVTYYGDEFGLPGANDPDNRRPMKFDGLNELEQQSLSHYTSMSRLRANHLALQYGSLRFETIEDELLVFERAYFDESVWVFFNVSDESKTITFEHPFTGESFSVELSPISSLVQVFHP
jgi:glycosidase